MPFGLFSDIHSNLEALEVVLNFFDKNGVKKLYCCGDVVGYGPDPERCIEIMRERGITTVAGNHDWAVIGKVSLRNFNPLAETAVRWTQSRLNQMQRLFLSNLPIFALGSATSGSEESPPRGIATPMLNAGARDDSVSDCFRIVHASLTSPENWNYILSLADAEEEFKAFTEKILFIGHSHIPFVIEQRTQSKARFIPKSEFQDPAKLHLSDDAKYLINVGSVGQSRDGDPRPCCVLLNLNEKWISFYRLNYEFKTTQKKMRSYRLPEFLAERLAWGR